MIPLTGYSDRLSAAPGERIAFKVSSVATGPYRARLARVVHADPNPAGPGVKIEDLAHRFSIERPSRAQHLAQGSYVRVDAATGLRTPGPLTVTALVWPTYAARRDQCVVSRWDEAGGAGWALSLGPGGATARVGGSLVVGTGRALPLRQWHRIWLVADPAAGTLRVGHAPLTGGGREEASAPLPRAAQLDAAAPLLVGARLAPAPQDHYNGKIEDPVLLAAAAATPETLVLDPLLPPDGLIAGWDFSRGIDGLDVTDVGPHRLGGRLVNLPTRAVTGARWTGREMCWRHAPREYAAIHFHDDDVYDAGWAPTSASRCRRSSERRLRHAALPRRDDEDELPFYVRPPLGRPRADVLLHRVHLHLSGLRQPRARRHRRRVPRAGRRVGRVSAHPGQHPDYGWSTYNSAPRRQRHLLLLAAPSDADVPADAISPSSTPRGSGLRHYSADTHLLDWLEAQGLTR